MKINHFLLLAASLLLASALTLSCSDDKDKNKVESFGCRPGAKNLCFEMPLSLLKAGMKERCEEMNDDPENGIDVGMFYENGCPSGSVLECDCNDINSGECSPPVLKFYFYDAYYKDITCDEMFKH